MRALNTKSCPICSLPLCAEARPDAVKPSRILFVEEVTALVKENLPDLWTLGYLYLSKSLYAVSAGEVVM